MSLEASVQLSLNASAQGTRGCNESAHEPGRCTQNRRVRGRLGLPGNGFVVLNSTDPGGDLRKKKEPGFQECLSCHESGLFCEAMLVCTSYAYRL